MDSLTAELGYVTNAGFTQKRDLYNEHTDDVFAIQVEVEMSDHADTIDGAEFDILFAVSFGDEFSHVGNKNTREINYPFLGASTLTHALHF